MANANEQARYDAAQRSIAFLMVKKEAHERKMYGCTVACMKRDFDKAYTKGVYIMGILSDVQEAMEMERYEMARQFANKAKYLMANYLPKGSDGRMI